MLGYSRKLHIFPFLQLTRQRKYSSSLLPQFKERKIKVLDIEINYIETVQNSANATPIFYLPGSLGSIEHDFKPILHDLNQQKYKWISWDPPGYGKSRPPNRDFISEPNPCIRDVKYVVELMNIIGYPKYVLLGWSGGAATATKIAVEQPEKVSGMIIWGASAYFTEDMIPKFNLMKKMGSQSIPEPRKSQLLEMYGENLLQEMWNNWCDELVRAAKSEFLMKGGEFQKVLESVQCPVLIIHGTRDTIVDFPQAQDLHKFMKNSRLHLIENGTHNLHLRNTTEFVTCVEQFVDTSVPYFPLKLSKMLPRWEIMGNIGKRWEIMVNGKYSGKFSFFRVFSIIHYEKLVNNHKTVFSVIFDS